MATYLLVQACQHLWLVFGNDVYQRFTCVALCHSILVPDRLDASSRSRFSRLGCHPLRDEATLSPELYYPGRILMAEHQVMSWLPTHHSHKRDFVSHPNARINPRRARAFNLHQRKNLEKNAIEASG